MKRVCSNRFRRCCPPSHLTGRTREADPAVPLPWMRLPTPPQRVQSHFPIHGPSLQCGPPITLYHKARARNLSLRGNSRTSCILQKSPSEISVLLYCLCFGNQTGAARPPILRAQYRHRDLGGIGVGGNAVLIEIF